MAYINFKEEKCFTNIEIEERKKNNMKLYQYIHKNKDKLKDYTPCKEYSFKEYKDVVLGKDGILDEADFRIVESKDIVCSKFIDCNFQNIKYKDCNFIGCVFENCNFQNGGVTFENCFFIKESTERLPSLNVKDNLGCSFYKCNIYARFLNCDLSMILFEECIIVNSSFEFTFIKKGILKNCKLDKINIEDCNLCGFKTLNCYIVDLDFNDNDITKFDDKTCFDKMVETRKDKKEYEGIYNTYETISMKFKENNLDSSFGEYYFLGKIAERKSLDKVIPKISSFIYYLTCGYGERPLYSVISSLVIILIFAIIYLFLGIKIDEEIVNLSFNSFMNMDLKTFMKYFNESLNLSVGMYGAVGFNSAKTIPKTHMISNIEMLLGIAMMGVGISTLSRKAIR